MVQFTKYDWGVFLLEERLYGFFYCPSNLPTLHFREETKTKGEKYNLSRNSMDSNQKTHTMTDSPIEKIFA